MDRFSRLGTAKDFALYARLEAGNVQLHLADSGRILGSMDDLGTVVVNAVDSYGAAQYVKNLKVNIKKGKEEKKDKAVAEGWVLSRKVPAWLQVVGRENIGNKIVNCGTIVENEKVAVVKGAYRLAGLGLGVQHIARQLNGSLNFTSAPLTWLTRTLKDRSVLGEFTPAGREPIAGYFPAIISQAEFDAARKEIARKHKNPGGNARHADTADNLFSGLLWDATAQRSLNFQKVARGCYLRTAFSAAGKSDQHSMHYLPFETAFLGFLKDLDWKSVAGQSESDEVRAAAKALDIVKGDLDKSQRQLAAKNAALEESTDLADIKVLTRMVGNLEIKVSQLTEQEKLSTEVNAARAKSEALYSPEAHLALIQSKSSTDVRLRMRNEIKKRVLRIEVSCERQQCLRPHHLHQ